MRHYWLAAPLPVPDSQAELEQAQRRLSLLSGDKEVLVQVRGRGQWACNHRGSAGDVARTRSVPPSAAWGVSPPILCPACLQKLADDLAKIMDEMDNVQGQLHKAQDYVQYLEPPARLIIDIREKQVRTCVRACVRERAQPPPPTDAGHSGGERIATRAAGAILCRTTAQYATPRRAVSPPSPTPLTPAQAIWDREHRKIEEDKHNALQRMAALRKLGPRPHLDL